MYTHNISWTQYNKVFQSHTEHNFNTTADAVDMHVNTLKNKGVNNLKVTELSTGKVTR